MPRLDVAPTKSNLLLFRRQLAFAEEGYDLLEQKRQILIFELTRRLRRLREIGEIAEKSIHIAFVALREATLDLGSSGVDRTALAVRVDYHIEQFDQRLMGLLLPQVTFRMDPLRAQFGVGGTSASTDVAMQKFVETLPTIAELAEIQTTITRLARELQKTQRRCNALSKIFIPNYRDTVKYIIASLDERDRESVILQKMIRDRLAETVH